MTRELERIEVEPTDVQPFGANGLPFHYGPTNPCPIRLVGGPKDGTIHQFTGGYMIEVPSFGENGFESYAYKLEVTPENEMIGVFGA